MTNVRCGDPTPQEHADLADTLCFLRAHKHLSTRRSCPDSRSEATAIIDCLRLLLDVREHPAVHHGRREL